VSVLDETLDELVVANRILANEGVVDGFGHVTVRHPERADRFFMACSRSPELVEFEDLIEFDLDCNPIDLKGKTPYTERPIHGAVYQARPEVNAVVHNHAYDVIPFTLSDVPLRQVIHTGGGIGADVPVWDIADKFGDTDFLVRTMEQGHDLACCLGKRNAALMRCHGAVVAARNLRDVVRLSVYLMVNARLQCQAIGLGGKVRQMSPGEMEKTEGMTGGPKSSERVWEYWKRRAGF
jgi:ribulose-5-phosphate 4-epimerase/fuculose-1-phosphate aldolase